VIAPARRAAFEVVRRVFEEDAYADRALAAAVEGLDDRDRALAQRLAYGTVQRARTIDFGIEQLGKRPVRKLDPPVRAALRLGAYQLAWTDQAVHAVTDDAVELVRAAKRERAVPFTNAVMRRLATGLNGLVASLPEGPLKHSYPDWIAEIWERDFGHEDALALMRAQNERPALEVRSSEPVGVTVIEGEVTPVECVAHGYVTGTCQREGECASRGLWMRLKQSIDAVLSQTTLAELVADQSLIDSMAPAPAEPGR